MPFVTTCEQEADGYQLFSVGIDDADREDRLAVVFSSEKGTAELLFALVDDEAGKNLFQLDCANSDKDGVASIHQSIREELCVDPDQTPVYLVADSLTDSTDRMLTLPPTIEVIIDGNSHECEMELDEGETVTVESRTITD